MKLSQKDLQFAYAEKDWQTNFTIKSATEAFECDELHIDYQSKKYLVTEGMRLAAASRIHELLKDICPIV